MSSPASAVRAALFSKPARWIASALLALIVLAIAMLYGASAWRLAYTYDTPTSALRISEPGSPERGDRLGRVYGCAGCHGTHGNIFFDAPMLGRLVAPDLARTAPLYSDAELITVIRAGIKRDRTSAVAMPTDAFSSLADADVADIIAWLRALKPEAVTETAQTSLGPLARLAIVRGSLTLSADQPCDPAPPVARPAATPLALGEYLVKSTCNHCHRLEEEHVVRPGLIAPPVRPMVQSYDLAQFTRLLRDGKALGDRELELMSEASRNAFSHLTDEEIAAIHAYLNAPAK